MITATTADLRLRKASNKLRPCSAVDGRGWRCSRSRVSVSQYCATHSLRQYYYGHPNGQRVSVAALKPWRREARRFLKLTRNTEPTLAAISIMGELLQPGPPRKPKKGDPRYKVQRHLDRLASDAEPVTALEALEVVLAVWLYSQANPRELPDDIRLDYAISRHVFSLRTQEVTRESFDHVTGKTTKHTRRPGGPALGYFGRRIRRSLGVWLMRVQEARLEQLRKETARAQALRQPITLNEGQKGR